MAEVAERTGLVWSEKSKQDYFLLGFVGSCEAQDEDIVAIPASASLERIEETPSPVFCVQPHVDWREHVMHLMILREARDNQTHKCSAPNTGKPAAILILQELQRRKGWPVAKLKGIMARKLFTWLVTTCLAVVARSVLYVTV